MISLMVASAARPGSPMKYRGTWTTSRSASTAMTTHVPMAYARKRSGFFRHSKPSLRTNPNSRPAIGH